MYGNSTLPECAIITAKCETRDKNLRGVLSCLVYSTEQESLAKTTKTKNRLSSKIWHESYRLLVREKRRETPDISRSRRPTEATQ